MTIIIVTIIPIYSASIVKYETVIWMNVDVEVGKSHF